MVEPPLITATAAIGWLVDRLGLPNPVARAADSAGAHTAGMLTVLGVGAVVALAAVGWTRVVRQRGRALPELDTATEPAV